VSRPSILGRTRRLLRGDAPVDRLVPRDAHGGRAVAFLAAALAFLAVMALALALATGRLAEEWSLGAADEATVMIIAPETEMEAQARAALDVLRATEGVVAVRTVPLDEQVALLEPWLGAQVAGDALPLPLLIAVTADRAALDPDALRLALAEGAPGAVFDDHDAWRLPLVRSAERTRIFAFAALGLLALSLAAVAALAAGAATRANGPSIRTLRQLGARDGYIAGAFTRRHGVLALCGALAGAAIGAASLAFLPPESERGFFLGAIGPASLTDWAILAAVPPAAALIAWASARRAVRRGLRRWS
jgi:cell division transport system permease protein